MLKIRIKNNLNKNWQLLMYDTISSRQDFKTILHTTAVATTITTAHAAAVNDNSNSGSSNNNNFRYSSNNNNQDNNRPRNQQHNAKYWVEKFFRVIVLASKNALSETFCIHFHLTAKE